MCRSSRILTFVIAFGSGLALAPGADAQGVRGGLAPAPMMSPGAPRGAIRPGVMPGVNRGVMPNINRGVLPNVHRGIHSGFNRGGLPGVALRRPGRFGGGAGSALGLAGVGLALADDFPAPGGDAFGPGFEPGFDPSLGAYPPPSVIPAVAPQTCIRPLIISVGRGLRRVAKTRVVYGGRTNCGR